MRWWMLVADGVSARRSARAARASRSCRSRSKPVGELCVTRGVIAKAAITEPTVRAFAPSAGRRCRAARRSRSRATPQSSRALANGQDRRQVGLKLRAQDGCNVVYVMWRLDPKPKLDVSVKRNPGKRTHEECGADGYTKVKPTRRVRTPAGVDFGSHAHAARRDRRATNCSRGSTARSPGRAGSRTKRARLSGPAGLRTDNVELANLELSAAPHAGTALACKRGSTTEE